jgi:hypothetical protein
MTTTPESRPADWAPPDPKICRGEDCTTTLAASDPDLCERCDLHGNVGEVRSFLAQIINELRGFPATADVPTWATSERPLGDQSIPKMAYNLLRDIRQVRQVVLQYAAEAEGDRARLAEHEQVAAGLRRAAAFLFGEQA